MVLFKLPQIVGARLLRQLSLSKIERWQFLLNFFVKWKLSNGKASGK